MQILLDGLFVVSASMLVIGFCSGVKILCKKILKQGGRHYCSDWKECYENGIRDNKIENDVE